MLQALERYEDERTERTSVITRMSNRIGKVAQLNDCVSVTLRNALFPHIPAGVMEKQLKYLYEVKFEGFL